MGIKEKIKKHIGLFNVVVLGVSFLLVFGAFQTAAMSEQSVLEQARNESNGAFKGSGYTSLSVIYATFSVFNWFAPFVVVLIGPRLSMFISSILYNLYIASFLKPMTWSLYLGSVLLGCAAAVIWTAQGMFLSLNSNHETISRNSGIFWAIFQTSLLFGNLYQYFAFKGEATITDSTRMSTFLVLTVSGFIGSLVFLLLRSPPDKDTTANETEQTFVEDHIQNEPDDRTPILKSEAAPQTPLSAFLRSFSLFLTRDMLMLMAMFAYTGVELTFFSGVYGTCLGHTQVFGDSAKSYIGLSGVFIGVGEIVGGVSFGFLGRRVFTRASIIVIGYSVHMVCFFLIFLNLPAESTISETQEVGYITPNVYVGMLCAFLLGFGDSSFNTQVMSLLGDVYAGDDCSSSFALYKFMQSLAAAAAFFYSTYLILPWQLLIIVILGSAGTIFFFVVDRGTQQGI